MCQNPHKLGEKKCWEKERSAELKLLALTSLFCCGSLRSDVAPGLLREVTEKVVNTNENIF